MLPRKAQHFPVVQGGGNGAIAGVIRKSQTRLFLQCLSIGRLARERRAAPRAVANQVRLHLFILAYNLGNFLRRLALPEAVRDWSLRSVQVKLVKIGGRLVRHARSFVFQLAEVAVPKEVFQRVLERIGGLCLAPG